MPDPEFALVDAIAHGDDKAFESLVKRYQGPLLNFLFRFVGDRGMAEDLTQEVFLRVYEAAHRFQERGRVSSWVFKIAYNLAVNELKRRSRAMKYLRESASRDEALAEYPAPDMTAGYELNEAIESAMGELPDNQRAALLLRVREGLSYREIAEALDLSVQSVDSLVFRARKHLRESLGHGSKE